jgi:hypothetical protein
MPYDSTRTCTCNHTYNLQLHKKKEPPAICQRLPCSGGRNIGRHTTFLRVVEVEIT